MFIRHFLHFRNHMLGEPFGMREVTPEPGGNANRLPDSHQPEARWTWDLPQRHWAAAMSAAIPFRDGCRFPGVLIESGPAHHSIKSLVPKTSTGANPAILHTQQRLE
jgi:hypothetical protein